MTNAAASPADEADATRTTGAATPSSPAGMPSSSAGSPQGVARPAATLPRLFASWVAEYGAEPALSRRVDGAFAAFSYDELDRRASVLALSLARELGVSRGELVALISDNRPEWLVCSLAIHFLGAVDVPRASDTPPDILEAILRHAEPAVVIVEESAQLPQVREALPGLRAAVVIDGPLAGGDPAAAAAASAAGDRACPVYTLAELTTLGEAAWPEAAGEVEQRRTDVLAASIWRRSSTPRARPAPPRGWHSPTPTTSTTCASSPICSASSASRCSRCCSRGTPSSVRCSSCT